MDPEITIRCTNLSKNFRVSEKQAGLAGSLSSFFKRTYRSVPAIQSFSFEAQKGEIVGLLGPNGAGKTTLMKMLTGIIVPSSGTAQVLGFSPSERKRAFRRQISLVMGQKSQLWWDIPALDSFHLLGKYYEVEHSQLHHRIQELADLLDVHGLLNTHIRKLSLGERMKMELMASLLHNPRVLFLDEPTIGLDLVAQRNIREFLKFYQEQHQTTILLTSHYMGDVQALAERIVLVLDGEKRFDDSIEHFESFFGGEKYVQLELEAAVDTEDPLWKRYDTVWVENGVRADLRIPTHRFHHALREIFERFPVQNFTTEKLPIERVLTSLLENPRLLEQRGESSLR
ncbi:ATP-binding cassette domain-containing protein [bacterium]|nr:ATP-binding cassette domain-containing protein [bacterium]